MSSVNITGLGTADSNDATSSDTIYGPFASQAIATGCLGPFTIGMLFQILLAGFALHFFVDYVQSSSFKADKRRTKALLCFAQLISVFDTACNFWSNFHYMTSQDRNTNTLFSQTIVDSFCLVPVGVLGLLVQLYLISRASTLFTSRVKKYVYVGFGALLIAMTFTAVLLYTILSVLSRKDGRESLGPIDFNISMGLFLWSSATVDVMITIGLIVQYRARMIGDPTSRGDSAMKKLIRLSIETASYTALCSLIGAILDFSFRDGDIRRNSTLAFQPPLSSLYYISLLVTLSSRERIRSIFSATPDVSFRVSQFPTPALNAHNPHSFLSSNSNQIGTPASEMKPPILRDGSYGSQDPQASSEALSTSSSAKGPHQVVEIGIVKALFSNDEGSHYKEKRSQ